MIGEVPSSGQVAAELSAESGTSRAATYGGTASTTPSARRTPRWSGAIWAPSPPPAASSPRASRIRERGSSPPEGASSTPAALTPSRTSAPSRLSRARPAVPCSSPSGASGMPMSAASFLPSSPVLTTVAARASEASSPGTFSEATVNRSHSTRRVRPRPGGAVRRQPVHVEPILDADRAGHAQPGQQALVGAAAAEEHVLAGIDDQRAPVERGGGPAPSRPGLQQSAGRTGLGQCDGGGDAGQAAADHHHPLLAAGADRD